MKSFLSSIHKSQSGFTIIEAIFTIAILTFGAIGAMAAYQGSVKNAESGQYAIKGMSLAEQKIEEIVADKVYRGYSYVINSNYNTNQTLSGVNAGFTRTINIYEVNPNDLTTAQSGSGYKRINVVVRWGNGSDQNVTMNTLVANY